MRCFIKISVLLVFWVSLQLLAQTPEEFIQKAEENFRANKLEEAAQLMEQAIQKYPDNSSAYSYLGLYRGSQAGQTKNYMEAGRLVGVGFEMLNKGVELDPNNPVARFNRGLMSVKVPSFLGHLDAGIQDLEFLLNLHQKSPQKVPTGLLMAAHDFLAEGYEKKSEPEKAITILQKIVELAPGSEQAVQAEKSIANLKKPKVVEKVAEKKYTSEEVNTLKQQAEQDPNNSKLLTQLGKAYCDNKDFENAEKVLNKAIKIDSTNVPAYKLLISAIGELADKGYDERIYQDTDFRSNLAFDIAKLADKAVKIAPEDMELLLIRGSIGVMMPFFVGKLEDGMADLELVTKSDAPKETKAEAFYWLGMGHQKQANTYWIKVITEFAKTDATRMAFESMRPTIKHFDPQKHQKPYVTVEFTLGYRDELAPQTAVWIEDKAGNYVKTLYVSGFSAFAKEKQSNLDRWAKASGFQGTDAVTGASIDAGGHVYVWDLKDNLGKKVKNGEYVVKVETIFWPSMEDQLVSTPITIGLKDSRAVVTEGNIIPYLEVNYFAVSR